jgi:uncharacterized protein YbjQ (UPF0145 family)
MKVLMSAGILVLSATFAVPALARDDHQMQSIAAALSGADAQAKLDKGIRLSFAHQSHAKELRGFGRFGTNKKTNSFNKSDQQACNIAFLSAILALQERAAKLGANAVIDITSNYKKIKTESDSQFMCGVGALMAGVALEGTMVTLAK